MRPCEVFGNQRGQFPQCRLELALRSQLSILKARTVWIVDAHRKGKRFVVQLPWNLLNLNVSCHGRGNFLQGTYFLPALGGKTCENLSRPGRAF